MKMIAKRSLIVLSLALMCLSLSTAASQFRKSANPNAKHPFELKLKRHQPEAKAAVQRQSFLTALNGLSAKIAHSKANTVANAGGLQQQGIERLDEISGRTLRIYWNEGGPVPIYIRGQQLQAAVSAKGTMSLNESENRAVSFLQENRILLRIANPSQEFRLMESRQDQYGLSHFRYQQMYQGLEVWGRDVRVHLNKEGLVDGFNGRYIPTPQLLSVEQTVISEAAASTIAPQHVQPGGAVVSSRKLIYVDENEQAHVAWLVRVKGGLADNWHTFVDATTGEILKQYNHVMTDGPVAGTGVDLFDQTRNLNVYQAGADFFMIDASKPMFNAGASTIPQDGKGVIYTLDARNADSTLFFVTTQNVSSWNNKSAVSASANGALVYDFFSQVFNRNAIDGNGTTMNIVVNFKENFNNAFWNGQLMVFGNGDGIAFSDLAGATDVTAHEMSHGVIERTANLVYAKQPGALNESFADVFGVLFEFWLEGDNGDWFLGEDVTTPGIAGDVLRNMEDPGNANVAFNGQQPTRMSEFRVLPNTPDGDNGGVHVNSGIPNRAFFLFATHPAVGRDKAGEVYYQVLTNYLTRNAQFIDCRLAVLKAVDDVFGAGTPEATAAASAAAQAFDTVEIFDGNSTPPPPTQDPVQGQEFVVVTDAGSGVLLRYDPATQGLVQISSNSLFSRPTVTDDGAFILYVDDTNNVHVLASDGSSDDPITTSGGFSNIAISPSGQFLAATSTFTESVIYVFNLDDPNDVREIELYTPTTAEGTTAGNILYPDRIDWAADNDILMYDAFNITINASGDTTGYWDINLLRTSDGAIARLLPPQPVGIDLGNAVFASNTDNIIAFDFVGENGDVTVLGVNLNTGATGEITSNFNSLASPAFSNDDSKVYYHFMNQDGAAIWVVDLEADGITGSGNDQSLIPGGVFPVAYTVGARPTSVDDKPNTVPTEFTLLQNYPNPFNPETTIRYELPGDSKVTLKIFDITGRLVTELESGYRQAGSHAVSWNGRDHENMPVASGIYFYKLDAKTASGKTVQLTNKMTLLK